MTKSTVTSLPVTQSEPATDAPTNCAVSTGSSAYVIVYNSATTGLKMCVTLVGADPEPGDEFGRNIQGSNKFKNAKTFTHAVALEMLPKVREVHLDAWIMRADGTSIPPHSADMD